MTTVFFNLLSAESNDDLEALAQKMSPILTRHANDVSLNPKLFARIKYVHDHHRELTPEESMLLEKSYDGFVRSGALLDEKRQAAAAGAHGGGQQTESHLLAESVEGEQGLLNSISPTRPSSTDFPIPSAKRLLRRRVNGVRSGWVFTLDAPSYVPFMMYSSQRDLRKKMYMARATQGTHDNGNSNIEVCKRLINLRREMAQLLGYKTYADYVMKYRMASNVKNVYKLLDDLIENYKPTALKEQADIQALARKLEGDEFEVMPWDSSYYSHKLKLEKFDLDPEMLRPYLEVSNVIKGVFGLATRLYGITFKERNDIPVYNPDVRTYEVSDTDGSYLALLYVDFHPRKGKQDGAWMTEYQGQWIERDGTNVRPHVSLVMNLSRPTADKPALLNLSEVETFLHEFGHSLHGMFANTRFESLSGTNVWWDFVEMPSQFMENYAVEKDFLHTFAFHYKTGEPMPDELIDKVVASRNFNAASACLRQVSFGLLDMAYYTLTEPFTANLMEFEKKAWAKAIITKQLPDTCMTTQFSHIMAGGYAAGYYSYKWAEVLDADVFSVFKMNGIFDKKTAQSFRDNILSRGGTEHPMVLYKALPRSGAYYRRPPRTRRH